MGNFYGKLVYISINVKIFISFNFLARKKNNPNIERNHQMS